MSKGEFNSARKIVLPDGRGPLIVEGHGIEVEFRDRAIHVRSSKITTVSTQTTWTTTASPAALKVGDVVAEGPNKGWIYCETKQCRGFLVAPEDSGVMRWRKAMKFAANEKAELPTWSQLNAMFETRDIGAFKGTFNESGANPAGWYWSSMQMGDFSAWCQNFRYGFEYYGFKIMRSSVRCVRRCSVI